MMEWVYWAIVGAAVIHVAEEYRGGFLVWFPKFSGLHITMRQFVIVNALFVLLCVTAALLADTAIVFSLSVAALIFINACIHIIGAIRFRRYAPGLVSAALLYVPLALYAYDLAITSERLTPLGGVGALFLGAVWHGVPLLPYLLDRDTIRNRSW